MADVEFQDFSFAVKAQINDISIAWLNTWAPEIASRAKDNCKLDGDAGVQLRKSYRSEVDESKGIAVIGSSLEAAFWEEFGTGSHADKSKNGGKAGREDWWVYYENNPHPRSDTPHYTTQEEAEAVAARLRKEGKPAYATNGRDPNYTLEKAFKAVKPKAIANLEKQLKGMSNR